VTVKNNSLSGPMKFSFMNANVTLNDSLSGSIKFSLKNVVMAVNAALKGMINSKSKAAYKSLPSVLNASFIGVRKVSLI